MPSPHIKSLTFHKTTNIFESGIKDFGEYRPFSVNRYFLLRSSQYIKKFLGQSVITLHYIKKFLGQSVLVVIFNNHTRSYFEDRNTTPRVDKGKGALISISFGASLSQIFNVASLATEINLTFIQENIKKPREGTLIQPLTLPPIKSVTSHISSSPLIIISLANILFTAGENNYISHR